LSALALSVALAASPPANAETITARHAVSRGRPLV
jgi:hypothetical protein